MKGHTKTSESLQVMRSTKMHKEVYSNETRPRAMIRNCKYCRGKEHLQGRCPTAMWNGGKCNHFASVCMLKPRQNVRHIDKNEQNNKVDDFEYYNIQKQDDHMSKPKAENTGEEFFRQCQWKIW